MSSRAKVGAYVTMSLADAEQRLVDVLLERPSMAERLSRVIVTRRNLGLFLMVALLWLLANRALAARTGVSLDPFPFHHLQRVLVICSVGLATMAARVEYERDKRIERILLARRDLADAVRRLGRPPTEAGSSARSSEQRRQAVR